MRQRTFVDKTIFLQSFSCIFYKAVKERILQYFEKDETYLSYQKQFYVVNKHFNVKIHLICKNFKAFILLFGGGGGGMVNKI